MTVTDNLAAGGVVSDLRERLAEAIHRVEAGARLDGCEPCYRRADAVLPIVEAEIQRREAATVEAYIMGRCAWCQEPANGTAQPAAQPHLRYLSCGEGHGRAFQANR